MRYCPQEYATPRDLLSSIRPLWQFPLPTNKAIKWWLLGQSRHPITSQWLEPPGWDEAFNTWALRGRGILHIQTISSYPSIPSEYDSLQDEVRVVSVLQTPLIKKPPFQDCVMDWYSEERWECSPKRIWILGKCQSRPVQLPFSVWIWVYFTKENDTSFDSGDDIIA
jgi:hypothetical protein